MNSFFKLFLVFPLITSVSIGMFSCVNCKDGSDSDTAVAESKADKDKKSTDKDKKSTDKDKKNSDKNEDKKKKSKDVGDPEKEKLAAQPIVVIDGKVVLTRGKLEEAINQIPEEFIAGMENKEQVTDFIIDEAITQAALNKGATKIKDIVNSQAVKDAVEEAKEKACGQEYVKKNIIGIVADDKLVSQYYEQYIKNAPKTTEYSVKMMPVRESKKSKISELLKESPDKFEDIAKEYDLTLQEASLIKEEIPPFLMSEISKLDKGQVSGPVVMGKEGKGDCVFIKLVDKKSDIHPSKEKMMDKIKIALFRQHVNKAANNFKQNMKIQRYDLNGKPVENKPNLDI